MTSIEPIAHQAIPIPRAAVPLSGRTAIEAIFRHLRLLVLLLVGIEAIALLATLLTHKQYKSQTKFLVQNARGNVVITPEKTGANPVVSDVTEEQLNSELEVLHSQDVVNAIADPGWKTLSNAERTPGRIREHEKLLASFEKRFSTELVRKSDVIDVNILAKSPAEAQGELQALSAAYLAEHRKLQRPSGASGFFANEAARYQNAWNDASQKLVAFQQEHHLISVPDQAASIDKEIVSTQEQIHGIDATLHELDGRIHSSSAQLASLPERQTTMQRTIPNQASVEELNTLLVRLQNKRTELLTKFRPEDRLVKEADRQIADTKAALSNATTMLGQENTTDVAPAWQIVNSNLAQTKISRDAAVAQRGALSTRLDTLQKNLADLQTLSVQFNTLQSQDTELKDNYQLYAQKRDQAQMEDAMDEQKLLNVAVAETPTLSFVPVKPRPVMNMLLATVTALFLGICAVYFAELGRSTVATPRELEAASGYPVLATIPVFSLAAARSSSGGGSGYEARVRKAQIGTRTRPLRHAVLNFWKQSGT